MKATPDADVEYVEDFLLQIMNDEFEVNVDDHSGEEIAAKIVGLRKLTLQGDFVMVDDMYREWMQRKSRGGADRVNFQYMDRGEEQDDTDWDSDDVEDNGEEEEVEEAPSLVRVPKEKVFPKVDEEGFTEVVSRKKR